MDSFPDTLKVEIPNESTAEKPKKRTVKEFLAQYRFHGLPGAKKFRQQTKIQKLQAESEFKDKMVVRGITLLNAALGAAKDILKEENWAVREIEGGSEILWIGDDEPLEQARKVVKEIDAALGH